ncbi:nuclear transport factor 2 family protein [Amycolatopsis circi]|uniref:nuclear transport factor 2 family protein n=1 Tax=Amycolatopsis circi TaxID=871959 RepID=UPI001ABFD00B|nr:nuclear transport factor 2 family protein [Amycolatopsis circi]
MTAPAGDGTVATVDATVYAELQQFYAGQMQLLDDGAADEWARTFTLDGVFEQNVLPRPWRGRDEIAAKMRAAVGKVAAQQLDRRHWIGMVTARLAGPDVVHTRYYATVVQTRKGGSAELHLSTCAEDVLVRDGGSWLVEHRSVRHDGTAAEG